MTPAGSTSSIGGQSLTDTEDVTDTDDDDYEDWNALPDGEDSDSSASDAEMRDGKGLQ